MPFSPFSSFSPSVSAVFPQFCIFSKSLLRCFALRRSPCHLFSSYLTASNEDLLSNFVISPEIQSALDHGKAIVALESTVITHGLPHPTNLNVAIRLEEIVREENAVPATIALLDGHIHVGLSRDELKQIAMPERNAVKVSRRDLATCLVEKKIGGTTVAATMWIAHRAGIRIFATGGIGGVHRGDQQDVSADLTELGRTPIGVVCAGVKSLLDIGRTLEYLETQSVCVVVLDKNAQFPGFFGPPTALKAPYHTNSLQKIADILVLSSQMGLPNGTLIACPLTDDAIDQQMANGRNSIAEATETALREADEAGIRGKEVTPFVLQRIRQRVGTAATELNIALLENNVRIGAQLALLCSNKMSSFSSTGKRHFANATSQCQNVGTLKRGRPKIVCAGASIVDVAVFLDNYAAHPLDTSTVGTYVPARIVQTPGGVARNHADALSRLGCDVTLISALGTMTGRQNKAKNGDGKKQQRDGNEVDLFGRFLMDKCKHIVCFCSQILVFLKTNGIYYILAKDWSHVCHCLDTPTASSVGVCSKGTVISQGFISVDSIMEHIDDKYLRSIEGQIANADFVLVDANLNSRSLRTIAEMAQMNGTKIWFEPTNWTKVPKLFEALGKNALHKVSAISPNMDELEELAEQLEDGKCQTFVHGFKAFLASLCSSATPAAHFASLINQWIAKNEAPAALFPPSMSHLLITCDSMGVLLLDHPPGSSSFAPLALHFASPPNVCADQIVSVSGAGDCFNSGFLAALLSGCSIDESVELANKCATISLCSAETVPEAIDQLKLNGNWVANA